MNNKPHNSIELFAGAGGLALGLEKAGFEHTALAEWNKYACETLRINMKGSYFLGGGRTGMARRLSWDEPCLTLTCSPSQNQTERCYPDETQPLSVREYARIQTFPDDWQFFGSMAQQYRQIGNAVPVHLAKAVGESIKSLLVVIDQA